MGKNTSQAIYLLDTNIILRFLLNDHPEYSKAAKEIFEKISTQGVIGFINHVTLAETYFVLTKVYKIPRKEVVNKFSLLLQVENIKIPNKALIIKVLNVLQKRSLSFVDIYNLFYAISHKAELKTFDSSLKRLYARLKKEVE